jgi:hypothetical protein
VDQDDDNLGAFIAAEVERLVDEYGLADRLTVRYPPGLHRVRLTFAGTDEGIDFPADAEWIGRIRTFLEMYAERRK